MNNILMQVSMTSVTSWKCEEIWWKGRPRLPR